MLKQADSLYIKTDATKFTKNLGLNDTDLQRALETIDQLNLNLDVVNIVGMQTPATNNEYPDISGHVQGDSWTVFGLGAGIGYTFATGSLVGLQVFNGDLLTYTAQSAPDDWAIVSTGVNAASFYRRDGLFPLTGHLQTGGYQIKNVANATDSGDVLPMVQADSRYVLETEYGDADILAKIKNVDGTGSGLDADLLDGLNSTDFASASHNHDNHYVNLTGDKMTGGLEFEMSTPFVELQDTVTGAEAGTKLVRYSGAFEIQQLDSSGNFVLAPFIIQDGNSWPLVGKTDNTWTINNNVIWHAGNFNPDDKEDALGNPTVDGYILSSDIAGNRSWIAMTGGGGAGYFTELLDVPNNYEGHGGKYVKVNQTENGLVFEAGDGGLNVYFADILGNATDNASLASELNALQAGIDANSDSIGNLGEKLDDMFLKKSDGNGGYYIEAQYNFASVGEVSAFGTGAFNEGDDGGDGVRYFIELEDVPDTYIPNKLVATNSVGNGLEFVDYPNTVTNLSKNSTSTNVTIISSSGSNVDIGAATTSVAGVMTSNDKINLDTVVSRSHVHDNKAYLDTINQNMSTSDNVSFVNITATGNISANGNASVNGDITANGNITAGGEVTAYSSSDIRLKQNIIDYVGGLDAIMKLNPITFNWNEKAVELNNTKNTKDNQLGFIAQDVEQILPELVGELYGEYKGLKYELFAPILVRAIQEQQYKIEELNKKIEALSR